MTAWLIVVGMVMAGVQSGLSAYAWVLAYVYVVSLLQPFRVSAGVAFVSGLAWDVLHATRLGVSSLVFLAVVGVLHALVAGRFSGLRRQAIGDGLMFVPFAVIDALVVGSLQRLAGDMVAYFVVYGVVVFVSSRRGTITVRRPV